MEMQYAIVQKYQGNTIQYGVLPKDSPALKDIRWDEVIFITLKDRQYEELMEIQQYYPEEYAESIETVLNANGHTLNSNKAI